MDNKCTKQLIERLRQNVTPLARLREAAAREQGMAQNDYQKRQADAWKEAPPQ